MSGNRISDWWIETIQLQTVIAGIWAVYCRLAGPVIPPLSDCWYTVVSEVLCRQLFQVRRASCIIFGLLLCCGFWIQGVVTSVRLLREDFSVGVYSFGKTVCFSQCFEISCTSFSPAGSFFNPKSFCCAILRLARARHKVNEPLNHITWFTSVDMMFTLPLSYVYHDLNS